MATGDLPDIGSVHPKCSRCRCAAACVAELVELVGMAQDEDLTRLSCCIVGKADRGVQLCVVLDQQARHPVDSTGCNSHALPRWRQNLRDELADLGRTRDDLSHRHGLAATICPQIGIGPQGDG